MGPPDWGTRVVRPGRVAPSVEVLYLNEMGTLLKQNTSD
jgi:hypothetical protein